MRELTADDLGDLARGAAILGTGGGGDPYIGRLLAQAALDKYGPVPLTALDELPDDAEVLPVAMMGAPTVALEKLPSIEQVGNAVRALGEYRGKAATHIACIEAGGINSLTPVVAAAQLGLPLIDADGMGRAFPELQMVLPTLIGVQATPTSITDEKGNHQIVAAIDNHWAERLARSATVDMGCSTMVSLYGMTGSEARASLVDGTVSLCVELGRLVTSARNGTAPADAVAARLDGRRVFDGKVVDVARRTEQGFARGEAIIEGLDHDAQSRLTIAFQNENLIARRDGVAVATVPDLICVLDRDTGEAITTETLRYGHRVTVLVAPADPRWHTSDGLALAGPQAFGYELEQ
ncbi:DUF917 domain-containing protein [Streptomyces coffeae]|uniref:DUF917 domain-containing protein n=1 Tax=Streptomyces coffeae TaxID=621382 RepID=A0ABS1NN38_9ACTN|nr:DUF917 domain-containing protein [Streptomyces coffeae]MBL1101491.1 DUF917 domain-containing protein [Streptomyces coffeae]